MHSGVLVAGFKSWNSRFALLRKEELFQVCPQWVGSWTFFPLPPRSLLLNIDSVKLFERAPGHCICNWFPWPHGSLGICEWFKCDSICFQFAHGNGEVTWGRGSSRFSRLSFSFWGIATAEGSGLFSSGADSRLLSVAHWPISWKQEQWALCPNPGEYWSTAGNSDSYSRAGRFYVLLAVMGFARKCFRKFQWRQKLGDLFEFSLVF